jgi:hypothetical protein
MNGTPITAQQVERLSKLLAEADKYFEDRRTRAMAFIKLGEARRILAAVLGAENGT